MPEFFVPPTNLIGDQLRDELLSAGLPVESVYLTFEGLGVDGIAPADRDLAQKIIDDHVPVPVVPDPPPLITAILTATSLEDLKQKVADL